MGGPQAKQYAAGSKLLAPQWLQQMVEPVIGVLPSMALTLPTVAPAFGRCFSAFHDMPV
jgi:hypothetical protein